MSKWILGLLAGLFSLVSVASADILEDFDSLGGNDELLDRARALNPEAEIRVVQDRIVPRRWRHEFALDYGYLVGGEPLLNTQFVGVDYHLHITPRWSVGLHYAEAYNEATQEGRALIDKSLSKSLNAGIRPDYDPADNLMQATINWYPIYGKMNLLDLGVIHFDTYILAGYGQITMASGPQNTWTTGAGIGLWFSQHLTARLQLRYQRYEAQGRLSNPDNPNGIEEFNRDIHGLISSFSLGYML